MGVTAYENKVEIKVNPGEDLICVCSNCHRMFHRKKNSVPTPDELKKEIEHNKMSKLIGIFLYIFFLISYSLLKKVGIKWKKMK